MHCIRRPNLLLVPARIWDMFQLIKVGTRDLFSVRHWPLFIADISPSSPDSPHT